MHIRSRHRAAGSIVSLVALIVALGAFGVVSLPAAALQPAGKVGVCHATGSETNPFVYIEVNRNSTDKDGVGHHGHAGDVIGVDGPADCPAGGAPEDPGNGSGDPGGGGNTVGICHVTGSATNRYVYIEVNEHAVPAHQAHAHDGYVDLIGVGPGACVTDTAPPPPPDNGETPPEPPDIQLPGISRGLTPDLVPALPDAAPPADAGPADVAAPETASDAPATGGNAEVAVTALPSTGAGETAARTGTALGLALLSMLLFALAFAVRPLMARHRA